MGIVFSSVCTHAHGYLFNRNRQRQVDPVRKAKSAEDDVLVDIKLTGQGCSISQASSSMMSSAVKGKSLAQVREAITSFKQLMTVHATALQENGQPVEADLRALGELAALQGVVKFPVRIKCATLAWNTLSQGLDELN